METGMKYGMYGAMVPLLVRRPAFAYLDKTAPGVDPDAVRKA